LRPGTAGGHHRVVRGVSSRPPRTGSIAAPHPLARPLSAAGSSRPPRTGSIAAPCWHSWRGTSLRRRPVRQGRGSIAARPPRSARHRAASGRPVRQGRAPLRLILPTIAPSAFCMSSRPPRTGSIAAAHRRPRAPASVPVVPSAKDGLHCGQPRGSSRQCLVRSSRPPRTGSIAASMPPGARATRRPVVPSAKDGLHCGDPGGVYRRACRTGRPVRQRRAPLRPA